MMSILNRIPLGRLLQKTARSASKSSIIYNLPLRNDTRRNLSGFSFAGPRKLEEIVKTELIEGKNKAEISDIWMTYHENQKRVHGTIVSGEEGKLILERADKMYVDDILMHSFNSIQCKTLFVPSLRILTKSYCYINTGNFSSSQSFETRVFSCYYLSSRRHPTSSLRTWRTTKWIPIAHSLS